MEHKSLKDAYIQSLRDRGTAPEGFRFGVTPLDFFPSEREIVEPLSMNLSAAILDRPTESFAAVFTQNQFPGAPVIVGRERLNLASTSGVLVNNRIANVCAPGGEDHARLLTSLFARRIGVGDDQIFPSSTGIIGWKLPVDAMTQGLDPLEKRLGADTPADVACGIMTTDSFPKLRSVEIGDGRIVGIAKGAGMIEPNLATLLVFIFTDVTIGKTKLQRTLEGAVRHSFNIISVDGDQSTSDTVLALSSNIKASVADDVFEAALSAVCYDLALDVVRNGEGTEHVMRVRVSSAPDEEIARECAKAVINAPLVKTAVCGNDPNVGRIIGAIGDFAGSRGLELERRSVKVVIGNEPVFSDGVFTLDPGKETRLAGYLKSRAAEGGHDGYPVHERNVEIAIDLGAGTSNGEAVGSDLTHGYVSENADYRS